MAAAALAACGRSHFDVEPCVDPPADPPPGCSSAVTLQCGDSCIMVCAVPVTRPAAATMCVQWGGCLATIVDQVQNDCVAAGLPGAGWIGALQDNQAAAPDAAWSWCDGSPWQFANWTFGE